MLNSFGCIITLPRGLRDTFNINAASYSIAGTYVPQKHSASLRGSDAVYLPLHWLYPGWMGNKSDKVSLLGPAFSFTLQFSSLLSWNYFSHFLFISFFLGKLLSSSVHILSIFLLHCVAFIPATLAQHAARIMQQARCSSSGAVLGFCSDCPGSLVANVAFTDFFVR